MQTSWPPQEFWNHSPDESMTLQVNYDSHNAGAVAHCDHTADLAQARRDIAELQNMAYQMLVGGNTPRGQGNNKLVHFPGQQQPTAPPIFTTHQTTPAIAIYNTEARPPAVAVNHPSITIYNTIINRSCSHRPRSPSPPPSYRRRENSPPLLEYLSDSYRYERSRSRSRSRSRTRWYTRSTPSPVYEPSSPRLRTTEAYSRRESGHHRRSRRRVEDAREYY